MGKVRKAITAGLAAGLAVVLAGLGTEIPKTQAGWVTLIGSAAGAAVVTAYGVWRVPNEAATTR